MNFAEVLLPFGDVLSNRPYTYSIPEALQGKLSIGDAVYVPFRSGTASGIIVGFTGDPNRVTKPIRERSVKLHPVSGEVVEFSKWLAGRYSSSWWDALRGFLLTNGDNSLGTPLGQSRDCPRGVPGVSPLTGEQEGAAKEIRGAVSAGEFRVFLLHGVTGSGKTEVYLDAARAALAAGKEALILVPEIPLSFQLAKRFRDCFGDLVAVLHSGLTEKEKRLEQAKLHQQNATIVIGPRMALFAPFQKLGLIVMDEEHDTSYKQENSPRYHAFAIAQALATRHRAPLVLGSATPSLESYYQAREGKMHLLTLPSRFLLREFPEVEVVDLREQDLNATRPFSARLLSAIRETVASGRQAILFMNRRGFSPLLLCRECGFTFHCTRCSIALTYHHARKLLRCHYCDYRISIPKECSNCHGTRLTHRGFGTERLEERIRELVPEAKPIRLDRDAASRRGAAKSILESFASGQTNVLIGTQMVTKGFDFPNVNLVGIISADHALHFPDFRSAERTFQLLTQVSGRAGRGSERGRVILQTYDPDHPAILAAAKHDYSLFYDHEIENRRKALYPPFVSLANFLLTSPDESELENQGNALREFLKERVSDETMLLGPAPCPIEKISKNFRWHLLVKSKEAEALSTLARETYVWYSEHGSRKARLVIDIDPVRLL